MRLSAASSRVYSPNRSEPCHESHGSATPTTNLPLHEGASWWDGLQLRVGDIEGEAGLRRSAHLEPGHEATPTVTGLRVTRLEGQRTSCCDSHCWASVG